MKRLLLAALLAAPAAHAATVAVTITGIRNDHGHVLVTICTRAEFLGPHCAYHARAAAHPGQVTIMVQGVPAGTYAAQAFHDENDNDTIDRTFLGMPEEGMGFSNDAPMRFGPPSFDTAAFTLGAGDAALRFKLRYF
jgi:uncharacterized protein (DUF2141 family)